MTIFTEIETGGRQDDTWSGDNSQFGLWKWAEKGVKDCGPQAGGGCETLRGITAKNAFGDRLAKFFGMEKASCGENFKDWYKQSGSRFDGGKRPGGVDVWRSMCWHTLDLWMEQAQAAVDVVKGAAPLSKGDPGWVSPCLFGEFYATAAGMISARVGSADPILGLDFPRPYQPGFVPREASWIFGGGHGRANWPTFDAPWSGGSNADLGPTPSWYYVHQSGVVYGGKDAAGETIWISPGDAGYPEAALAPMTVCKSTTDQPGSGSVNVAESGLFWNPPKPPPAPTKAEEEAWDQAWALTCNKPNAYRYSPDWREKVSNGEFCRQILPASYEDGCFFNSGPYSLNKALGKTQLCGNKCASAGSWGSGYQTCANWVCAHRPLEYYQRKAADMRVELIQAVQAYEVANLFILGTATIDQACSVELGGGYAKAPPLTAMGVDKDQVVYEAHLMEEKIELWNKAKEAELYEILVDKALTGAGTPVPTWLKVGGAAVAALVAIRLLRRRRG